jgi:hypothetical protein
MRSRGWRLRLAALLAGASFAVHQLRFTLAPGSNAHQGHAYLTVLAPIVVGVLMLAVAQFAGALTRGRASGRIPPLRRLWLVSSAALLAVYCLQELAEGLLSPGHAGVFAAGGWAAAPLALVAGLVVALLMRAAAAVELAVARGPLRRPAPAAIVHARPLLAAPNAGGVFLCSSAPRAPPARSL